MELKEILAISGAPGLYKFVAQGKGGIIVESLADGRRTMVGGSTKVSALGDIAVFTASAEVSLGEVLQAAYDKNGGKPVAVTSKSSPEELKAFMASVLPDYDTDRVHNSDIKKIAQWYNALLAAGMTSFKATEAADAATDAAAVAATEAPKKKASAGTAGRSKATASAAATKPAQKAASRSKAPAARNTTARKAQ